MSERCPEDVWRASQGYLESVCKEVSGGCLEGVLRVSGGCLNGVYKVSRGSLEGVCRVFESVSKFFKVFQIVSKCFKTS